MKFFGTGKFNLKLVIGGLGKGDRTDSTKTIKILTAAPLSVKDKK